MITQAKPEQQDEVESLIASAIPGRPIFDRRIPEEIEETRRIFALSRPPRPLPPGKTWQDMVVGKWPGDETDEEFQEMLDNLRD